MADIKVLTGREAVRLRPGMYIGDTKDGSGIRHMFLEVFSNAVDAVFEKEAAQIDIISVYPNVVIRDNGPGFPFEKKHYRLGKTATEFILEELHAGATIDGHWPHFHMKYLYGVGLAVVNFLSETFQVKAWRNGDLWMCEYKKGVCTTQAKIIETGTGVGTEITFRPDPEIFETFVDSKDSWENDVSDASYLCPRIKYIFLGREHHSKNGLSDLTVDLKPRFSVSKTVGDFFVDVAIGGKSETETRWKSWVNGAETLYHGSHVDAVKMALTGMNWTPATVFIHATGQTPRFAGPTRGELSAPDLIEPLAAKILSEYQKQGGELNS